MKKLFFLSVFLIFITFKGFGQGLISNVISRLEVGVQAGGNYSNFQNANFSTDYLTGFHGGLTVAYKITDNFLFQEEFTYSQIGAKIKGGTLESQDLKLHYMAVPFLLKYRSKIGLFIEGGAQFGYKLHENVASFDGSDFAKKYDFSGVGGIGFQSIMGLGIDFRYVYGLSKVGNYTNSPVLNNDFRNVTAQASLFYVF